MNRLAAKANAVELAGINYLQCYVDKPGALLFGQFHLTILRTLRVTVTVSEDGDSEGWGQSPHHFDSRDPRSSGPGSAQAHTGADLRGGFSRRIVWLSAQTDSASSGAESGASHR